VPCHASNLVGLMTARDCLLCYGTNIDTYQIK
jgi:hypothetical protein